MSVTAPPRPPDQRDPVSREELEALVSYVIHLSIRGEVEFRMFKEGYVYDAQAQQLVPRDVDDPIAELLPDYVDKVANAWLSSKAIAVGAYKYSEPDPSVKDYAKKRAEYEEAMGKSVRRGKAIFDSNEEELKKHEDLAKDLANVHTVPDPYYVTNPYEQTSSSKIIRFVNLPQQAIIRIYTASGVLVRVLDHNSSTFAGEAVWDVRNRNNQVVASGVYFYHIESGEARKVGRFTVVNFAQ